MKWKCEWVHNWWCQEWLFFSTLEQTHANVLAYATRRSPLWCLHFFSSDASDRSNPQNSELILKSDLSAGEFTAWVGGVLGLWLLYLFIYILNADLFRVLRESAAASNIHSDNMQMWWFPPGLRVLLGFWSVKTETKTLSERLFIFEVSTGSVPSRNLLCFFFRWHSVLVADAADIQTKSSAGVKINGLCLALLMREQPLFLLLLCDHILLSPHQRKPSGFCCRGSAGWFQLDLVPCVFLRELRRDLREKQAVLGWEEEVSEHWHHHRAELRLPRPSQSLPHHVRSRSGTQLWLPGGLIFFILFNRRRGGVQPARTGW